MARREGVRPPTEATMQWKDMPAAARRDLSAQIRNMGMARSAVPERRAAQEGTRDDPTNAPLTQRKATQRLASMEAIEPHLVDRPITMSGAAAARVGLVKRGGERAHTEGTDPGHDWYFQHNGRLGTVAYATGFPKEVVVAASAVMSPQNNPEQELTAVHALARAHANPLATIQVSESTATRHPDMAEFVGQSVHPREFSPDQLARLSEVGTRETVRTSGVDLSSISKGGVKGNVEKSIRVLRGDMTPGEAINPRSSPKVWSYHDNIAKSEYASPEHEEFVRRMRVVTNTEDLGEIAGQQSFGPLFPELRGATHGPLDPTGHTAEDTWQQAISTRQQLAQVPVPGRTGRASRQSPAKFTVGEGGAANDKLIHAVEGMVAVGESSLMHAWQNRATQQAAARLSRASGEIVPTIGIQTGGWVEARREAGKAIEEQEAAPRRRSAGKQLEMITPSGGISPGAKPPPEYRRDSRASRRM